MGAELDAPEADDNPKGNLREIAAVFNSAVVVSVEFHGYQYKGDIVEVKIGDFIAFKVKQPDDGLVRVPIDYDEITLRVLMTSGEVKSFNTKLLNKNIPLILLQFPDREKETFTRSHPRHHVNISTPIILESRENVILEKETTGLGTITNLSEGGCKISTSLKLERGDGVKIFIQLTDMGSMEMTGTVRRAIPAPDGVINYGLRFVGLNIRTMRELEDFMKRTFTKTGESR